MKKPGKHQGNTRNHPPHQQEEGGSWSHLHLCHDLSWAGDTWGLSHTLCERQLQLLGQLLLWSEGGAIQDALNLRQQQQQQQMLNDAVLPHDS